MTGRAALFNPNETFEIPKDVSTPGSSLLMLPYSLNGFLGGVNELRVPCSQGKSKGIKDEVLWKHAVFLCDDVVDSFCDL